MQRLPAVHRRHWRRSRRLPCCLADQIDGGPFRDCWPESIPLHLLMSTGIHPNEPSYHRFKLPLLSCAKGWLYSTSEPVSSLCQVCRSVGWVISPSCTFCPSRNVLQLELELKLHCLRAVVHNGPFLRARSLSRRRRDASSPGVFAAVIAVDQTAGLAMNHYLQ